MYDITVFTSIASGAHQPVEQATRETRQQAVELRSRLAIQYPPHAFLITIREVAAQRER